LRYICKITKNKLLFRKVKGVCTVKKTLPAAIALLVLLSGAAMAESLPLDKAIETALANNTDLQRAAVAYQQAKRAKDNSWNKILSTPITMSVGISNTHPLYPEDTNNTSENWPVTGSLDIGANLTFSADTPVQIKLLASRYRQAETAYEKAVQDLSVSVASSFYSLLAEKMNTEILKTDMELKKAQYDQVRANYNRGLASELDMLNAQYTYMTAGPAVDSALSKYDENLAAFFLLLGIDPGSALEPEGAIEIRYLALPQARELSALYLLSRNDIQSQINTLEQTRLSASSRIRASGPSLRISESIGISSSSKSGFDFEDPTVSGKFSVTLSIPIDPWIPGTSASLDRKNDKDSVALAETALDSAKKAADQDIQKKVNAVVQNSANIESSELNYRIAARAYELTEQGYRSGLVSQTDLQSANQRRLSAEQAAVTTKIAYLSAVYNVASALNMDIAELYRLYAKDQ
jgi:multidrug efflux system outer membrane protein